MTDRIPIKANFSGADPISLAEFQTGDTVPILNGGTGRTDGVVGGFKNKIINGNFGTNKYGWQRGTSGVGNAFVADRWKTLVTGSTVAVSQQAFAKGQTDVPGNPWFFHRTVVTSVAGAGNRAILAQLVEDASLFAAGQCILSFYAKADAARSMAVELSQDFGSGGSPSTAILITPQKINLTSSWQKFTLTFTMPSVSGKTFGTDNNDRINLFLWYDAGSTYDSRTGTLGQQSGTFDLARVQLEEGPTATAFEERPPGIEALLCYRFYWETRGPGGNNFAAALALRSGAVVAASGAIWFPVEMRGTPVMGGVSSYVTGAPASAGQVTLYDERTAARLTISGALTNPTILTSRLANVAIQAGTSFGGGAAGDFLQLQAYNLTFDAEI